MSPSKMRIGSWSGVMGVRGLDDTARVGHPRGLEVGASKPYTPEVGGVVPCAAQSAARAGLEVGVPSRCAARLSGSTRLRACGPACRPEVGVPSRVCCAAGEFYALAGLRPACRPEVGVPSRVCCAAEEFYALCGPVARVPTGGRRSKPGCAARRRSSTRLCGPVARVPTGGRRSKPGVLRGGGVLRALRACGPRADRRSAFQAGCAARLGSSTRFAGLRPACRPEVGVPSRVCCAAEEVLRALRACGPRADRRVGVPSRGRHHGGRRSERAWPACHRRDRPRVRVSAEHTEGPDR